MFYLNTACDIVTVLLIFEKYLSLYLHIFACKYTGTHTRAHMHNQHTRGMVTTRHRSLVESSGKKALVRDKDRARKQKKGEKRNVRKNLIFTNLQKKDSSTYSYQQSY